MAQAGIHGLISIVLRKWTPVREWLVLGIVVGSLFPDADNLAVAVATVAKLPTEGLHRTFTHSLLAMFIVFVVFYGISKVTSKVRWANLGIGLSIGILLHVLVDLLIWFDGVEILWPNPFILNLWAGVTPPVWWSKLMLPMEFFFFALLFWYLYNLAKKQSTDIGFLKPLSSICCIYCTGIYDEHLLYDNIRPALSSVTWVGDSH
jgi:membrane-bound metal-dependent hydrolase YbcI (DUF457 family)